MSFLNAQKILHFWFEEIPKELWFKKDPSFDELIRDRFLNTYEGVRRGESFAWRETPRGYLAEIIVLDQFPRNMFRDTARAFESDAQALVLAEEAVGQGIDQSLSVPEKAFLYMPYMHSEDRRVHEKAVVLFSQPGLEYNLDFEMRHKAIIDRFGRYPHRNEILGRKSTSEELEFLKSANSRF